MPVTTTDHRSPPLGGSYAAAVAIALLGLSPNIVLTTAFTPLRDVLMHDLHTSRTVLELGEGLSNAGYAFGAVLAADLAQRFLQRRLFLIYEVLFVAASLATVLAPDAAVLVAGRVVQGTATGLMLVSALPPLITRFPAARLPITVAFVDIGLFGATTLGPLVGGVAAQYGAWRLLLGVITVLGALGVLAGVLGFDRWDPPNPDLRVDAPVFPLAAAATVLPFLATSLLGSTGFAGPLFWAPLAVGLVALVTLVLLQYHRKGEPLMPVRALSSTLPVAGTLCAMLAGAAFVAVLQLAELYLKEGAHVTPLRSGLYFAPLVLGVLLAAWLFSRTLATRWLALLVLAGLAALALGVAVMLLLPAGAAPAPVVTAASVLLGFGAGASVAPGLFGAALAVPSNEVGRAFALVELLRSEAAFLVGPVLIVVAGYLPGPARGVRVGLLLTLAVVGLAVAAVLGLFLGGRVRLRAPDLDGWLEQGNQALESPPVAAAARSG